MRHKRSLQACPGQNERILTIVQDSQASGHRLHVADHNEAFVIVCCRCWAYGTSLPKALRDRCLGEVDTKYTRFVKSRFERCKHPKLGTEMTPLCPLSMVIQAIEGTDG